MNLNSRSVRVAGAVGAVIAAGTTTVMALTVGSASADEPGRCTQNVNVREEPDVTSRIVALCESGTEVVLGEERDDFVRLAKPAGWVAKDFVKPDASAAVSTTGSSDDAADESADVMEADRDGADGETGDAPEDARSSRSDGEDGATEDGDREAGAAQDGDGQDGESADATETSQAPAPRRAGGIAGLLG